MEFDTENVEGATGEVAVIRPRGRLTMVTTTGGLRTPVADTVGAGHAHVVVDLSQTEFVDSSVLHPFDSVDAAGAA
jgi:anti-anti-sigma regulatory factor